MNAWDIYSNITYIQDNVIYTYQPKLKIITYEMKKPLLAGDHTIQIKIRDQAENETVKNRCLCQNGCFC